MSDDFDFGFTVDEIPESGKTQQPVQAEVSSDQMDVIMDKLEQLESRILDDNTGMINEHQLLLESDVSSKLQDVENLILHSVYNLKRIPKRITFIRATVLLSLTNR